MQKRKYEDGVERRDSNIFAAQKKFWILCLAGAYPEIFLGGFGIFFLENPSKLKKIPKKGG